MAAQILHQVEDDHADQAEGSSILAGGVSGRAPHGKFIANAILSLEINLDLESSFLGLSIGDRVLEVAELAVALETPAGNLQENRS